MLIKKEKKVQNGKICQNANVASFLVWSGTCRGDESFGQFLLGEFSKDPSPTEQEDRTVPKKIYR